ncbi:MAG TPA: hypothetical protein VGH27_10145 [Streptosporangiaceae bacterium]|jgi:hypothetical protein
MRKEEQQPGRTHRHKTIGLAFLAAAAVAVGMAPAASAQAASVQAAPVHATPVHALTARALMARSTPASAAARLAHSPYTLPSRAGFKSATAGNLATSVSLSRTDVWAVGASGATPFAEQYNGSTWTTVAMATPKGSTQTTFAAVTAISVTDLWAVGNYENASGIYSTLAEHWNGTTWKVVATPNQTGWPNNYLYSVSGDSASDIWAVGTSLSSNNLDNSTLVEHYNGKTWTEVTSPNPDATYDEFSGVDAISPTDVLAVGSEDDSSGFPVMLSETWNGNTWTQQPTPTPSGDDASSFANLSAISPTNIWATGFYQSNSFALLSLSAHWNGKKWTQVSSPNPAGNEGDLLIGMDAQSAKNIWTVGLYLTSTGAGETLTEHYNGTTWSIVDSPNVNGATDNQLTGVAAPSANVAWAFGDTNPGGTTVTLREHWNGTKWALAQG